VTVAPNKKRSGFQKGQSGNPAGRKPGSRSRASLWIESITPENRDAIHTKMTRLALRGDRQVLKMYVDRADPPRKGAPVRFPLPAIKTTGDVVTALAAIAAAMAKGLLSPSEALEVAGIVELQRRAIETQEIETRLHALEGKLK
jgi:hypothetical protein